MLIVIVIIGILAAALIPRLTGMPARARDAGRKADLNQLGTAITAYFTDFGSYPSSGAQNVSSLSTSLSPYLSSIPSDPLANRTFIGIGNDAGNAGDYRFTTIQRNGIEGNAFVIMAATESYGASSNYVVTSSSGSIDSNTEFNDITLCNAVSNT